MNKCKHEGCSSYGRLRKGYCDKHYDKLRKYGSPVSPHKKTVGERFHSKYEIITESGCWIWTGGVNIGGYGKFQIRSNTTTSAHRVSWELHFGEIPKGMFVCHKCDNPPCVNPDHLFIGTAKDNAQDKEVKLRGIIGEKNHNAKLTNELVQYIRESSASSVELSNFFGVDNSTIAKVRNHKTWTKAMQL